MTTTRNFFFFFHLSVVPNDKPYIDLKLSRQTFYLSLDFRNLNSIIFLLTKKKY